MIMNVLKITLLSFSIVGLISCNDGVKKTKTEIELESSSITKTEDINTNTKTAADKGNNAILKTQDMTAMYSKLNMTDDQIKRFEEDYKQKLNTRTSDNIVDHNLVDLQMDESLKNVLSSDQYAKYQELKKSNSKE